MTAVAAPPAQDMAWVPGGTFAMGDERFYPEERPVRDVAVKGFWMDEHPVTVAEFRRFVKATGHVTAAELAPEASDYPGADPANIVPGSIVFRPTQGPVPLDDNKRWWAWVPGACWRRPEGPGSDTYARGTPWCTSPTRTRSPTPSGPARRSRPRRSGSARRAAGSPAPCTRGATSRGRTRPTPGRATSRGAATAARPRSAPSPPTASASTT